MEWTCPICTCRLYVSVTVARPDGKRYRTEFFRCASCTAMFMEPELFDRQAIDARPQPTAAQIDKVPALASNLVLELAYRYLLAKLKREDGEGSRNRSPRPSW